jgi:hypothetical protein
MAAAISITRVSASHIGKMQALESTDVSTDGTSVPHNNMAHVYWSLEAQMFVCVWPRFSYRLYILLSRVSLYVSLVCHNKQLKLHYTAPPDWPF